MDRRPSAVLSLVLAACTAPQVVQLWAQLSLLALRLRVLTALKVQVGSRPMAIWDGLQHHGTSNPYWQPYQCPHCSQQVAGAVLVVAGDGTMWLRCPSCTGGAVQVDGVVYPSEPFGPQVEGLLGDVADAYEEARVCMGVGAHTAVELICRKILMHVAADKGAPAGQTFVEYVNHLEGAGYITPPMKPWVDLIRKHGNVATHELPRSDQQRAENTFMFTAELLRLIYEMDYMAQKYIPKSDP